MKAIAKICTMIAWPMALLLFFSLVDTTVLQSILALITVICGGIVTQYLIDPEM